MIAANDPPCILVYNPISGKGHLDSWNAMFISILLNHGWRVLALTPSSHDLLARLNDTNQINQGYLQVLPWEIPKQNLLVRAWGRLKRECFNLIESLSLQKIQKDTKSFDNEAGYLEPIEFAQRIQFALKQTVHKPLLMINMYMDLYRTDEKNWQKFQSLVNLPWIGIRFVPAQNQDEGYYKSPSLLGMCFLDEIVCAQYEQQLPAKLFTYLPDITDTTLPVENTELVHKIRTLAQGRKIVFMGGAIGANKNLARWYDLINLADPAEWYFLQIGEVNEASLPKSDLLAYQKILRSIPENLMIKAEYLPDEKTFNDVIYASDIIFAVYRDFKISSNMPGKAAAFNKPILVAEQHLMGRRVEQFGIGLAVPQDSVERMLVSLNQLRQDSISSDCFQAYRNAFSIESLERHLFKFIDQCIELIKNKRVI